MIRQMVKRWKRWKTCRWKDEKHVDVGQQVLKEGKGEALDSGQVCSDEAK